jgi:hypothetical protein
MIASNFLVFLEKDTITIMAKLLTHQTPKVGLAILQLFDAATMQTSRCKTYSLKAIKTLHLTLSKGSTAFLKN